MTSYDPETWGRMDTPWPVRSPDAELLDRLHTAEARCAILESKWQSVPWEDLYDVILIATHGRPVPESVLRVTRWRDLNEPQEPIE